MLSIPSSPSRRQADSPPRKTVDSNNFPHHSVATLATKVSTSEGNPASEACFRAVGKQEPLRYKCQPGRWWVVFNPNLNNASETLRRKRAKSMVLPSGGGFRFSNEEKKGGEKHANRKSCGSYNERGDQA